MVKSKINRVIIKATGPQPKAPDLGGYTRYDIPWNDGTGENLYIWMKPDGQSQDVFIGSDENLKVVTRSRDIIFKTNTAGVVSSSQAQATLRVIQTNAVYTYRLILSVDHETLTAAGGTAKVSAQLEAKIGDEIIYTKEVNPTITLQGSTPGFSLNGSTLTVENRTTAIGNARTCTMLATVNTEETGEEVFSTIAVTQEGNYVESISLTKGNFSYANTVAAGQVVKPTSNGSTPVFTFTSGSTTTVVPSSTYGTVSRSTTYSSQASEGFSAANTETGAVTVASRGTTIGNARTSNKVTRHESYSFVPSSSYNTKGQVDSELDSQATVTQAENVPVSVSVTPDFTYPSGDIPASGGTKTPRIDADITITWSSGGTSTADETGESGYTVTKTPNWSMTAADGFTIDSSTGTVTAENRGTTEGDSYTSGDITLTSEVTINISEEYGGGSVSDEQEITKDDPVTQAPNHRIQVFSKPTITEFTVVDIPAKGGTVNSGEVSYHQASIWYYDSGETAEGPSYTEGGSVQFGSAITAASLGTNVKSRSVIGTLTCTVSMNGQTSVEGDAVVYQQANAITSYGNVNLTVQTPINCDVLGGSYKITPTASQTITYTSEATRAGALNLAYAQKSAMSGFSLSGQSVTVTENKSTSVRNGYTVTVTATGEGSKSASKEVVFNQAAGTKSYANPVISVFTYPTIAAKGGTVTPNIEYSQTWGWNDSTTDGGTITTGAALSFTGSKVTSEGSVSASTKGTTVSGVTTVDTVTLKVTLNNKSVTKAFTVQQAANAITTYGNVTISGGTVADIPAAGGTISSMSGISASQTITYTSGATRAGDVDITYSTAVKASSLGTTVKARTKIGTLTATAKGEGSKSATKSLDVYQAANTATYGNVTITGGTVADIPASGGSASSMSGISASQTISFTSGASRDGEVSISYSTAVSASSLSTTVKARTKVGTLTATATGEGSKSATKSVDVYQAANSATYGNVTITGGSISVIPASGGSVSSASGISASQTVSFTSGATRAGSVSISYSTAVSASSKGTTISNQTTAGTLTATATGEGSKKATKQFTVYQAKNVPTAVTVTQSCTYPTIDAGGGTVSYTPSASATMTWSSGSSSSAVTGTGVTVTSSRGSFSMPTTTGFTLNTSNGQVTGANRATTVGNARTAQVTSVVTFTVTISSTYGGGTITGNKSYTATVTQEANNATYGAVSLTANNPSQVANTGGSATISASASQTVSFTSGSTRAGSVSITYTQKAAVSGFSLSGNKVTVSANHTTSARSYVVVVKATGEGSKSASKEVTVSQAAGVRTYSGITLNVSYSVIPASGGTSTPSISYSQTWGWNGATTGGGTITSGGTLTYSGTSVSTSNGAVSAGSKGTTVSEVTTVTTATVKVSLNGKSASKQVAVQQAANTRQDEGISYGSWSVSIRASDFTTVLTEASAGGESCTITRNASRSRTQNYSYTSGETSQTTLSNETATPSLSASGTGLSISGTTATWASRGNIGGSRRSGIITATYSGVSKSVTLYQESNSVDHYSWNTLTISGVPDSIPASGGTYPLTSSVRRWPVYTSGASGIATTQDATSNTTFSVSGSTLASISGKNLVVSSRGIIEGAKVDITIKATYSGQSTTKGSSIAANSITSTTYGNPVVTITSVADIPASGGSVNTGSCTYSQSRAYTYSSGSTLTGSNLVSGGSVSWTSVSADSKGTTVSGRTSAGTITCTVTMNGKIGSKTATVYQAANAMTKEEISWISIVNTVTPQEGITNTSQSPSGALTMNTSAMSFMGFRLKRLYREYASGSTYDKEYSGNDLSPIEVQVTSDTSWATILGTNFLIQENTTTSSRTCTLANLYDVDGEAIFLVFELTQPGVTNHLEVSPTSLSFTASGGTKSISIDTNESWTIS